MFTLDEKIGQMMMVGFHGTTLPDHIKTWLETGRIGGLYLFARNIETPQQVKQLVDDCHAAAKYPILVGIDQEGGIVARMREGFTEGPGAMALGASGDTALAEQVAYIMGRELLAMGFNWNFAPVADISHNALNPSVGTRSVGTDVEQVSQFVQAQIRGYQRAGVAATIKHFPGLGNTPVDTHDALARISGSIDYLYDQDLVPYRGAIDAGVACVMTTHVLFEELDSQHPTTLSPVVLNRLLRTEIGYDGVVCTDCMEMNAITDGYGASESAILTVLAGVDLVMFSHTKERQEQAYLAVINAVKSGRISEERIDKSVARIQELKQTFHIDNAPPLDVIASKAHQDIAQRAANAGTVLVKSGKNFPLNANSTNLLCIEFTTQIISDAVEAGSHTAFMQSLTKRNPDITFHRISLDEIDQTLTEKLSGEVARADTIIVATRNAHMLKKQGDLAKALVNIAKQAIVVCLRNPYDAGILDQADTIISTNGDSTPSLQAAASAVFGEYTPTGKLTVAIN